MKTSTMKVVEVLNRMLKADPDATAALINHRVPCNDELRDDPTIQCGANPEGVGMLGVINGLLGVYPDCWGSVQAVVSDGTDVKDGPKGTILRFEPVPWQQHMKKR